MRQEVTNLELFSQDKKILGQRAILIHEGDLRSCLATGELRLPCKYKDFAPILNDATGWGTIDLSFNTSIEVADINRACLVTFRPDCKIGQRIERPLPADYISNISFFSKKAKDQWVARASMFGLPKPIPAKLDLSSAETKLLQSNSITERWPECERPIISEEDRIAGSVVGLLLQGALKKDVIEHLLKIQVIHPIDLHQLCFKQFDCDTNLISMVLSILAEDRWQSGFDAQILLIELAKSLRPYFNNATLEPWVEYVGAILTNNKEARNDGLRDQGKIFLRALELFLRTSQPTISSMAEEVRARGTSVGASVAHLAIVFAGWFEGFGSTGDPVKAEPSLYSLGSRIVVSSNEFPLRFEKCRLSNGAYSGEEVLLESGRRVASCVENIAPALMEAFYAAGTVCKNEGWAKPRLVEISGEIEIEVQGLKIFGTLEHNEVLKWRISLLLNEKSKKIKTWPKGFLDRVLILASKEQCAFSSLNGYPNLEISYCQLLKTMDHDEIKYAMNIIQSGYNKYLNLKAEFFKL